MEPEEKKLYLEIKKGEKSDIKAEGFDNFISEMKKVGQNEKARIEGNRVFYENRENEILSFHKKIVEAKTLNELTEVRRLIKNRISALNHKACEKFPDLNNTLSRLKDLLQIADEEIKEGTIEDLKRILQNGENKQQIKTQQNISTWGKMYADISGYLYSTPEKKDPKKLELYVTQLTQLVDILENGSNPIYLPADYWPVYHKEQKTYIKKFSSLLNSIEKTLKYYNHVKQEPETPEPENKFLNIFKEGGYELFCYLNENYTRHDKQLPTKYSNLYRFLDYEQFIVGTQDQYKDFIKGKFGIKFSKVTKGNYTYTDNVFNLLTRLKSQYKNQLKST
ncbi:MAG: hypothetical protein K0B11_16080 [Mariniphaga sp.]|nr:hypothetical protein [Mariniphaga sp.]